ncbi:MAG TPA: Fic family protein [Capsulimonadaceae bacterium]|jgi:Fic family protein
MEPRYIHQLDAWPHFRWDIAALADQLASVRNRQGFFLGRIHSLGFNSRELISLDAMTDEVQKSSEIEGDLLDRDKVRSSIARRLGLDSIALAPVDCHVDGVVEMLLDATQNYSQPLTKGRLFGWHAALFPSGYSGLHKITVADWRNDSDGPMQVVSGRIGHERVHYEAPSASRLEAEMSTFLEWFETPDHYDPVIKAAIAHLWFVSIHPFADGNGRIGRAIADMALARSEHSPQRFYSMSAQIQKERAAYYEILENTQKRDLDATEWIRWFLACLGRAIEGAEGVLNAISVKADYWDSLANIQINERQREMINRLLDGFEGKVTARKWGLITKTSMPTALRDINDLIDKSVLVPNLGGGRSASYRLSPRP